LHNSPVIPLILENESSLGGILGGKNVGTPFPFRNPVSLLERSKVEKYSQAKALEIGAVSDGLATIDESTLPGKRDKAILLILLQTGRRVAEIASLTWGNVEIARKKQVVTLHFPRTKGDKFMSDTLPDDISAVFLTCVEAWYGKDYALTLDNHAPLWVILAEHHTIKQRNELENEIYVSDYGKPLQYQGIAGIVKHYLGTTKVHRTRHTFAKLMLQSGASVKELQGHLGHANVATTDIYAEVLTQAENPYADSIAALLLGKKPS
jgi:site-specific recombinase XerD